MADIRQLEVLIQTEILGEYLFSISQDEMIELEWKGLDRDDSAFDI